MKIEKFKVLLYLKKSGMDKNGKAPIMGRITVNRTMAQFSCKLSCTPSLWNPRASRLEGKRYPFPIAEHESCSYRSHHHLQDARSQGCEDDAAVCESDPKEAVWGHGQVHRCNREGLYSRIMNKAFNFSFYSSTTLLYYKDNNYEQKYILKTSVFNFCGSMLPGFADFNAKNNKKNLHDCNEYMNNDELRNTLKFSQLSRYANKQATTKLPRYTQSVAWLHSVHLLCTRQSVNGANRDHFTNNLNNVSYGKNKRCRIVLTVSSASSEGDAWVYRASSRTSCATT